MAIKGNRPADVESTELSGRVDAVIMRNEENGFAILKVKEKQASQHTSVKGPLAHVNVGEEIICKGRWQSHEVYGWSFSVNDVSVAQPITRIGLIAYLQNTIPGVGPVLAEKIVDRWGEKSLEAIDADPKALLEIKGVPKAKIKEIVTAWEGKKSLREIMLFLNTHGVTASKAALLYKAYGKDTIKVLKETPYRITELPRIGFKTADEIALHVGYPLEGEDRIDAGIQYVLEQGEGYGNVYTHLAAVLKASKDDLQIRNTELVKERVLVGATAGRFVLDKAEYKQPRVYTRALYDLEGEVAGMVRGLVRSAGCYDKVDLEQYRDRIAESNLTPDQWGAISGVVRHRFSVLTGNPGTGKSFSVRALLDLLDLAGLDYELAAPTGKAAKRLFELTGRPAVTIHRLLKWSPFTKEFTHDEANQLTSKILIVDEVSMVDLRLAHSLLRAVGDRQHVLFIGDKDQLPSVGAGKLLDDLLAVPEIHVTRLHQIFRQAARSLIIQNSRRINKGEFPYTQDSHVVGVDDAELLKDFFLIPRKEAAAILRTTVDFVANRIPRWKGYDPMRDVQVYAPMRGGPVGLDALNDALQRKLNPKGARVGYKNFRVGDKIIQTKNNYDYDLMNGETVIIQSADKEAATVDLETMDGTKIEAMPYDELWSFLLAYAISIHRSQGSQSPAVVIPISSAHYVMLKRNLLYTAVTRAEKLCVVVGEARAVSIAVGRVDTTKRNSGLSGRVNELLKANGNAQPTTSSAYGDEQASV